MYSHSQGEKHVVGDRNRKRDRRTTHPNGEHKQSPHKKRTVSPPHTKSRREEQERERLKIPIPQRTTTPHSRVPMMLLVSGDDVMGKAMQQISQPQFF